MSRILVACEFSGTVRRAFEAQGHEAWSCDLLPTDDPYNTKHLQCDVREVLGPLFQWDMMIAFPSCTHLAVSGARWFKEKQREQAEALDFIRLLLAAPVPRIALENPIGIISTRIRKPSQIIHPWQYGHPESKTTCLWLKNLPLLVPTNILMPARQQDGSGKARWDNQTPTGQNKLGPSVDRWKLRSLTYSGIAKAMSEQWG